MPTTKFVDPVNGNDTTGTGAIGAPWKTIAKAIGPTPAFTLSGSGQDVLVLIPSGPARETIFNISITPTATNTFLVAGDVDGAYQQAAGAATIYTGDPIWTPFAAAASPDLQAAGVGGTIQLNGKSYLTFKYMAVIAAGTGSSGSTVAATTTHSHDITFQYCSFQSLTNNSGNFYGIRYTNAANAAANWTIDSCTFLTPFTLESVWITCADPGNSGADLDLNFLIRNCLFLNGIGSHSIQVNGASTAANGYKCGGVRVRNCTFYGGGYCLTTSGANCSSTIPCEMYNSILMSSGSSGSMPAGGAGQIKEDFNWYLGVTATNSNVTLGPNSIGPGASANATHSYYFEIGQGPLFGRQPRPLFTPLPLGGTGIINPGLGFGNGGTSPGPPAVDALGRPRPSGGSFASGQAPDSGTSSGSNTTTTLIDTSKTWTTNAFAGFRVQVTGGTGSGQYRWVVSNTATALTVDVAWATTPDATSTYALDNPGKYPGIGYVERHECGTPGGSANADGGVGNCLQIAGPGDHELWVPVVSGSNTVTVKQKTSNYSGTSYPKLTVLSAPDLGLTADQAAQDTAANTSYTTLSVMFTTASAGVVKVRLSNLTSNGGGTVYWDTASVPPVTTTGFDVYRRNEPVPALSQGAATVAGYFEG